MIVAIKMLRQINTNLENNEMKKINYIIIATAFFFNFTVASFADDLTFGVYTSDKPTAMYKKFSPIVNYLQEYLNNHGFDTVIKLKILSSYDAAINGLAKGEFDFGRFGPASYILAKEKNNKIQLLCMEHKKGKKRFKGVFVVRKDSSMTSLADLKGKKIAFGDKNSTIGRFLAQAALIQAGIKAEDLSDWKYLDRHDKVALAVAVGSYDAGPVKENTFKKYAETRNLKSLSEFPNVTKPWIARAGLDLQIFNALRRGLLELKEKAVLKALKQDGFLPATDSDYDFVRKGMELAKDF